MFSDDDEDGNHMEVVTKHAVQFSRAHSPPTRASTTDVGPSTPFPSLNGNVLDSASHRSPNEVYTFSIGSLIKITPSITPQRSEPSSSHEDNASLVNLLGDTMTWSKQEEMDLGIHENARLARALHSETGQTNNVTMALTPPESPTKSTLKVQIANPASTASTLPWILSSLSGSDRDMGIKVNTS